MELSITGPKVYYTIPILGGLDITETMVNSWIIMAVIFIIIKILTHGMKIIPTKRQIIAEKLVKMVYDLVEETMGKGREAFAPYIGTLFAFSLFCSLSSLFCLRAPTADLNTTAGWAIITFFMIQINNIKANKLGGYIKGFTKPIAIMTPMNIISEIATPVSLAFRHFGNIAAGLVITKLIYAALAAATSKFLPVPLLQIGLPAVLSLYFDIFTSFMQAFIFCILTMAFVSNVMEE